MTTAFYTYKMKKSTKYGRWYGRPRSWLLVVAILNLVLAFDTDKIPYFSPYVWSAAYLTITAHIVAYYFSRSRQLLLRSTAFIIGVSFLRSISFFVYDHNLSSLAINLNVAILTWMFYKVTLNGIPKDGVT